MSLWTVVWLGSAEKALADIWMQTGQGDDITKASYQIDRALKEEPFGNGTQLREELYVIERHPLRAVFEVREADRLIR